MAPVSVHGHSVRSSESVLGRTWREQAVPQSGRAGEGRAVISLSGHHVFQRALPSNVPAAAQEYIQLGAKPPHTSLQMVAPLIHEGSGSKTANA